MVCIFCIKYISFMCVKFQRGARLYFSPLILDFFYILWIWWNWCPRNFLQNCVMGFDWFLIFPKHLLAFETV